MCQIVLSCECRYNDDQRTESKEDRYQSAEYAEPFVTQPFLFLVEHLCIKKFCQREFVAIGARRSACMIIYPTASTPKIIVVAAKT